MNHRSATVAIAATCAFVLAGIGATAAGAVVGASGEPLPRTPPSLPIALPLVPSTTVPTGPVPPPAANPLDGGPATPSPPKPGAMSNVPLPGAGAAGKGDSP